VQARVPSSLPSFSQRPHRLLLHAALLAAIYLVFLILLFGLGQAFLAGTWILCGLLVDFLLWRAMLLASRTEEVATLTQSLQALLEAQSSALAEQAGQIARLRAAVADESLQVKVLGELDAETQPNLQALVEDLVQAEQTLPESARQTRVWLHEARRLARAAQADVDAIRLQMAGR
jgi:hypothetical protein